MNTSTETPIVAKSNKVVIPTDKSEIDKRWCAQKFGMIGAAGIGKSEFWSYGENTLFIQTEAGLNHLSVYKVAIRAWDEFVELYSQLIQSKNSKQLKFDCIIIDTIDKLVDLANEESIARGRAKFRTIEINTVGDIPNGAGWMWATELISNALTKLEQLGICIAYVGHLDTKEVKTPTSSIHKSSISIGGKMGQFLLAWPDHLLTIQANMQGNKTVRFIKTLPTQTLDAKSRGGMVQDNMLWADNTKENYKQLRNLFQ